MIVQNSGRPAESTIGIAVSGKHPGIFKRYNITRNDFYETNAAIPTGNYARDLGQGKNILQRGNMIYAGFMGHTALFSRTNGVRREPVVGFFPEPGIVSDIRAAIGSAVTGKWHLDNWMFRDQAALAYEIPVSFAMADALRVMLQLILNTPASIFNYQIRQDPGQSAIHSRNCVAAILVILEEFGVRILRNPEANTVDGKAKTEVIRVVRQMKALLSRGGFKQGHMQQLVQTGFMHLPA